MELRRHLFCQDSQSLHDQYRERGVLKHSGVKQDVL